jgi:hypothetical protein
MIQEEFADVNIKGNSSWRVLKSWEEAAAYGNTATSSGSKSGNAPIAYHWGEYEDFDWEAVYATNTGASISSNTGVSATKSCYCIRKGLIRKANLSHNLV